MQPDRSQLRALVRGAYDLQALRIMMGNRLYANFRARLNLDDKTTDDDEGGTEESRQRQAKIIIEALKNEYALLTEGVARNRRLPNPEVFTGAAVIHTFAELVLVHNFLELLKREVAMFRDFEPVLAEFPIYTRWLRDVPGVGPAMAGMLLSEIDIVKADTPSKLWSFAGLDVARDGRGRSMRAEHLVMRKYTAKDGTEKERRSITYNPLLKTKLVGVLGGSFLRCRGGSPYADIYYDMKNRLQQREAGNPEWNKGRIHRASIRYMIKMFLRDLYVNWREVEGLFVRPPYHEEKLGIVHSGAPTAHPMRPAAQVDAAEAPAPAKPKRATRKAA